MKPTPVYQMEQQHNTSVLIYELSSTSFHKNSLLLVRFHYCCSYHYYSWYILFVNIILLQYWKRCSFCHVITFPLNKLNVSYCLIWRYKKSDEYNEIMMTKNHLLPLMECLHFNIVCKTLTNIQFNPVLVFQSSDIDTHMNLIKFYVKLWHGLS